MQKCGLLLQPLINLIHDKILEQKYLHMDETNVQVLNEPNKTAQSQSYMWVLRSDFAFTQSFDETFFLAARQPEFPKRAKKPLNFIRNKYKPKPEQAKTQK
jgi:hypothetical protein